MQTIDEVLDYIFSFTNLESGIKNSVFNSNYSLDNIENILNTLGNPHRNLKAFHIAGTKGKGSTTLFITKLLNSSGYSTLTFLSPHLIRTSERILYNENEISDSDLIRITANLKDIFDKENLIPTTFELLFIISLIYGKEKNADYFVIETGLGGRLDCTNCINPIVSIITSIGFDHTEILGNTIKKIAGEKAGIIKENTPIVVSKQRYRCKNVFTEKAAEKNSPVTYIPDCYKYTIKEYSKQGIIFTYKKNRLSQTLKLPLFGEHQINNFLTALEAVSIGADTFRIEKISADNFKLPGRIELIDDKKIIIADVSHTVESVNELVKTLKKHFGNKKWNILLGFAYDKNYKGILKSLKKLNKSAIVTNLSSYKKSEPEKIFNEMKEIGFDAVLIKNQHTAFDTFLKKEGYMLVTGSFYLTGPFLEYLKKT